MPAGARGRPRAKARGAERLTSEHTNSRCRYGFSSSGLRTSSPSSASRWNLTGNCWMVLIDRLVLFQCRFLSGTCPSSSGSSMWNENDPGRHSYETVTWRAEPAAGGILMGIGPSADGGGGAGECRRQGSAVCSVVGASARSGAQRAACTRSQTRTLLSSVCLPTGSKTMVGLKSALVAGGLLRAVLICWSFYQVSLRRQSPFSHPLHSTPPRLAVRLPRTRCLVTTKLIITQR